MIKTKKNLIIFIPFIGGGGVEKNLFLISNYLSKKIGNLKICTISNKFQKKFSKNIKFIYPKKKYPVNIGIRIKYIICLFELFKFLRNNKNSVVFSFQANIYCIIICKLLGTKVIVRSNSSPSGWYHNFLKKFIYKKIISLADNLVVNSLDFKKQMESKFNIKVENIFNPLNLNEIKKRSKEKIKYNFLDKGINIINIGRLTDQKNQITLLKSMNLIKNKIKVRLLIIGSGEEKNSLKNFIKKKNLSKFVKIKNYLENPYPFISKSDLFILSSKYEGLPNVLLEAAVLKKFIISTDCPTGPREILSNGKGGFLFNIGDYKKLSKLILYFYKNKKKLKTKINFTYNSLNRYDLNKNLMKYYLMLLPYLKS
tara:strand:- start:7658 stop:8764 length:1107 start_codon:yes stop_codon:yes gene_type:complete